MLVRDAIKEEILGARGLPLLWLPTTGSDEERRIRNALDQAEQAAVPEPDIRGDERSE